MSIETAWLADFKTVMVATLPGCSLNNIYRASAINRVNWRSRMDEGALTLPYYVLHLGKQTEESEFCPLDGDAFMQPYTVYGVFSTSDPLASIAGNALPPFDPVEYAKAKGHLFRNGLLAYSGGNFQILPGSYPVIDVSDENVANAQMLIQADMWAFCLTGSLLIGEAGGIGA